MLMEGLQLYYKAVRAVRGGFNIKAVLGIVYADSISVMNQAWIVRVMEQTLCYIF